MTWLNYHHLYYFWATAKDGTVGGAAKRLRLSQPTVSAQIRELERALGVTLFDRAGRRLRLTAVGQRVFERADEIFSLGDDILRLVGDPVPEVMRLLVGCADALPKLVAYRLLQPALATQQDVRLIARQGSLSHLLGQLAVHELDLVLADAPIPPGLHLRAFNHLLGESPVALFAMRDRAEALRADFPRCLDGEAMLCPAADTSLRRSVDAWLEANGVRPRIVGEFDDTGLLKTFARAGFGVFAAPTIVADELAHSYGVVPIGTCSAIRERFYAITLEQRIRHPAVSAISAAARALLVG